MRAPLSWIKEFVPELDAPVADIADALNQLGLEVEEIDAPGGEITGVIAARILDVLPHPDADKIRLADVDFGSGQIRVVCGAPNIEAGMVVPFAHVGASLPGGFEITRRKIRGVVSEGMLCSARELGLGDDHSGILSLPSDAEIGRDVREILGLDDAVFDLSITPNRPDAMCIVGVARELAAHFGRPLVVSDPPAAPVVETLVDSSGDVRVVVEAVDRCPRFVGRVAAVTTGESPDWMQRRLIAAGMRPISNVVDVTNYVLLERNRPLHAFDLGRLAGRGIVVRLADDGERMTTLDGVERTLTRDDLLICDAERAPQAIAGIMGGRDSEVDATTTAVLIESAYFEPSGIAKSSKRLGLRSEASARFERGIDPNYTAAGADYAIALLEQVASARAVDGAIDIYPKPIERPRITVRSARINDVLGTRLPAAAMRALLTPLGIDCEDDGETFVATTPTWRPDLEREIDIAEEVARRYGLERIERRVARPPERMVGALTPEQRDRRLLADALVGFGASEAMTMPLRSPADLVRAGVDEVEPVTITNPLRAEESVLRPSLRPGLLAAAAYNAARGNPDVSLFELGTVFAPPAPGRLLPTEREHVALVVAGTHHSEPRRPARPVDVGDAIDALYALAGALRLAELHIENDTVPGLHATRGGRVLVADHVVGVVGELAADVVESYGLVAPVVGFEVDAGALIAAARRDRFVTPVSPFPAATFDLAFVVDDRVPAAAVEATLSGALGERAESVRLFDVFRSESLGEGRVSLAFAIRLRAVDRTLTDADVAAARASAIHAVERAHAATLRG